MAFHPGGADGVLANLYLNAGVFTKTPSAGTVDQRHGVQTPAPRDG